MHYTTDHSGLLNGTNGLVKVKYVVPMVIRAMVTVGYVTEPYGVVKYYRNLGQVVTYTGEGKLGLFHLALIVFIYIVCSVHLFV